jgi:hypothetical protein
MRLQRIAAGALALSLAACSFGSSHYSGAVLQAPGSGAGGTVGSLRVPLVMPVRALCTTGKPIKITKVTAASPSGGMKVYDWGVRLVTPASNTGQAYGAVPGPISKQPGYGHNRVTAPCGQETQADQFDVLVGPSSSRGTMTGVTVHYAGGQRTFAQYDLAMCKTAKCAEVGSTTD